MQHLAALLGNSIVALSPLPHFSLPPPIFPPFYFLPFTFYFLCLSRL
jgi:hypothetical protein